MKTIEISTKNISSTNDGIFEGWGTSLCWWANRIGGSEKLTEKSAILFFSEDGLNLNIMRYNIGGGDDPSHNHIKRTDSEMPGWWEYNEKNKKFNFSANTDHNQLNILKCAYKTAGKDAYVEAFSNSPPFYMTRTGCSSGTKNGTGNNIKTKCIHSFANYLTDVCKYIQDNLSVEIKSLAAMNEPFTDYWKLYSEKQEGCPVTPGRMQSLVLTETAKMLSYKGLNNIIVTASDETNTDLQYKSIKRLSKKALKAVKRISTHTYAAATDNIAKLSRELNKNLWMSETDWSGTSGNNSGEMAPALWLAEKIIEDINVLSPSAWVIWQIVAAYISNSPDSKGRLDMPSLPDLTKGFWGTAFADLDKEEIYLTQKYYAFGQFTRYIRPGMSVIHTNDSYSLAAIDKLNDTIVIVAVNSEDNDKEVSFSFSDINIKNKNVSVIRTSGSMSDGEHWTELKPFTSTENHLNVTLIKHSITTYIIG